MAPGEAAPRQQMSDYEMRAWTSALARVQEAPKVSRIAGVVEGSVPERVKVAASSATTKAVDWSNEKLSDFQVRDIVERSLAGTLDLTFRPALRSASTDAVITEIQKTFPEVRTGSDFRSLDLEELDRVRQRKGSYTAASAVQGAGTSLAVTGAVVSTTVSGGVTAGAAIAAVAVDAAAALAMMGRSVGSVAARYGYDVRLPEEETFAMSVLSYGTAGGSISAKGAALRSLSRLTQEMARRPTWPQLNNHVLVRVIEKMYASLGFRLTQGKLGQLIPVVGVAINATMSANTTRTTYERAEDAYRLRFLSDKYGIDPGDWVAELPPVEHDSDNDDVIDVVELIDEINADESDDGTQNGGRE